MGCGTSSDTSVDSTNNKDNPVIYISNEKNQVTESGSIHESIHESIDDKNSLTTIVRNDNEQINKDELPLKLVKTPSKIDYDSIKKKLYEKETKSNANNEIEQENIQQNHIKNESKSTKGSISEEVVIFPESNTVDDKIEQENIQQKDRNDNINDESNTNIYTSEEVSPSESNDADDDELETNQIDTELLLDFETFILLPSIQNILLENKSVTLKIVRELFDLHDKDNDGQVNDPEREELLELINMSYSLNSPYKVNTMDKTEEVETENIDKMINNAAIQQQDDEVGPYTPSNETRKKPIKRIQHSQSVRYQPTDMLHIQKTLDQQHHRINSNSPTRDIDKDDVKKSYEDLRNRIIQRPKSENYSKSKSFKLHSPDRNQNNNENQTTDETIVNVDIRIPVQKRGFMTKHDSYEGVTMSHQLSSTTNSDNSNHILSTPTRSNSNTTTITNSVGKSIISQNNCLLSHNRFFVLDRGYLSYMDSTSKKPPFSLSNRELSLKGMTLKIDNDHNVIELISSSIGNKGKTNSNTFIDDDDMLTSTSIDEQYQHEPLLFEVKNASELDDWIDAFVGHIKYSDSMM